MTLHTLFLVRGPLLSLIPRFVTIPIFRRELSLGEVESLLPIDFRIESILEYTSVHFVDFWALNLLKSSYSTVC